MVKRATHRHTQHQVALKIYEKKNLVNADAAQALHNEINILAALRHPHIMRLHEVIDSRLQVHLVTELCPGPSLFH